jgi:hypothetical protein
MGNQTIGALTGTAGGTNVPLNDMSSAAAEISVVTRDAAGGPYRTVPLSALPISGLTEFDFIIRNRADLVAVVAPVANTFVLPNGSYFIKSSFSLNAGEGMQVPAGGVVFIQGGGAGKVITGGSAVLPLLRVLGACQLLTVQLTAAVAQAIVLDADGDVSTATQCVFSNPLASTAPCVQTSGTGRLAILACRITAQDVCVRHASVGERLTIAGGSRVESVDGTAIEITAANSWCLITDSIVRTTSATATGQAFFINAAGATVWITETEVASGSTANCVLVNSAKFVGLRGGEWQCGAAGGTVCALAGAITQGFVADGCQVQVCTSFVTHSAGAVGYARVSGCVGQNTVTTCVNWQVANVPTRGLQEQNNSWNATTANMFLNHQQNDARVMRRSNISSAGNTSETGIVP